MDAVTTIIATPTPTLVPGQAPNADPGDVEQCLNGGSCPTGTFPWVLIPGTFFNIQLDIVGFLAILGEATVLNNAQVAALSWTSILPRLIPAPQALIRTSRPERLDPSTGVVVGSHSGNIRRHVNHVPHILHQVASHRHKLGSSDLQPYHVRAIKIDWSDESNHDIKVATLTATPTIHKMAQIPKRHRKRRLRANFQNFGPLAGLAYFGCAQSIILLSLSIYFQDPMSILATGILSLVSTLTGLANYWKLELPERTESRGDLPSSDVIISYPNGSFLVVTCPEEIARIYFQAEQCAYWISGTWQYRTICLVATIMLMIGVICLANSTQYLQVAWACNYIAINAAYWAVAALPARVHWDMSSFKTDVVEFKWWNYEKGNKDGTNFKTELLSGNVSSAKPTFTEALWKTIGISGSSHWARTAEVAPDTNGWDEWLKQAERELPHRFAGQRMAKDKMETSSPTEARAASRDFPDAERIASVMKTRVYELPKWNYRQALTNCLRLPNRSRWSDFMELRRRGTALTEDDED